MGKHFEIRPAARRDMERVAALLTECGLPTAGVEEFLEGGYVVAEDETGVIGVGGVETYGRDALLRSVAVHPSFRGASVGRFIVENRIAWARDRGARGLYLLTLDADGYFERFGFRRTERDMAPSGIRGSLEFRSLCPETAIVMVKTLEAHAKERS